MRRNTLLVILLVLSLGLTLVACGSGDDDEDPTATTVATEESTAEQGTDGTAAETAEEDSSATEAETEATTEESAATETEGKSTATDATAAETATESATAGEEGSAGDSGEMPHVVLATGFVPSVNFAPFYLAAEKGYYAEEGLDVEIQNGRNPDLLLQLGAGNIDFGVATGDAVVPARVAGVPVTYVTTIFQKYPVGAMAIKDEEHPLTAPEDLEGLRVGVSAPNGSTYFGLLALLQAAGLSESDIELISIGFTELESLTQDRIDVAMTYLLNEPVQARERGFEVETLAVGDYVDLVSSGVVTSEQMINEHPDIVQKFVNATLRGLQETLDDPGAAFEATAKYMPEVTGEQLEIQRAVLDEALKYEQPPADHPLGWMNPDAWVTTQDFLKSVGVIDSTVDPTTIYTNEFVEQASQ